MIALSDSPLIGAVAANKDFLLLQSLPCIAPSEQPLIALFSRLSSPAAPAAARAPL